MGQPHTRTAATLVASLAAFVLFLTPACYRASDGYLEAKASKRSEASDEPQGDPARGMADGEPEAGDEANRASDETAPPADHGPTPEPSVAEATGPGSLLPTAGDDGAVRELFSNVELDQALPILESEIRANPSRLEPLLKAAIAGVGNQRDACEEIVLYLVIRHPHLASEIASTAAKLNPEIRSWRQ